MRNVYETALPEDGSPFAIDWLKEDNIYEQNSNTDALSLMEGMNSVAGVVLTSQLGFGSEKAHTVYLNTFAKYACTDSGITDTLVEDTLIEHMQMILAGNPIEFTALDWAAPHKDDDKVCHENAIIEGKRILTVLEEFEREEDPFLPARQDFHDAHIRMELILAVLLIEQGVTEVEAYNSWQKNLLVRYGGVLNLDTSSLTWLLGHPW
jgi:hypothetical protein